MDQEDVYHREDVYHFVSSIISPNAAMAPSSVRSACRTALMPTRSRRISRNGVLTVTLPKRPAAIFRAFRSELVMHVGALIALLRGVTLPFLASISAVFESQLARRLRAGVAIRAPICLTRTSKFLSLMNPLLTQMLGESASVEIQASSLLSRNSARARAR